MVMKKVLPSGTKGPFSDSFSLASTMSLVISVLLMVVLQKQIAFYSPMAMSNWFGATLLGQKTALPRVSDGCVEDVRAKGVFNANVMKVPALALRCRPVTHFEKQ